MLPKLRPLLSRGLNAFGSLFFPPHCAVCLAGTAWGEHLCPACQETVQTIEAPYCRRCSEPFAGAIVGEFLCADCETRDAVLECVVARYRSRGAVREFIHKFKYNRAFHLRHRLVDWLEEGLCDPRIASKPSHALVPVPLHPTKKREREFNQSEVIADLLSRRSGIPVWNCLKRTRYTVSQTRLDRAERQGNLHGAFALRGRFNIAQCDLILVDDVFTTGSTVEECARVLASAGARSIRAITVARA